MTTISMPSTVRPTRRYEWATFEGVWNRQITLFKRYWMSSTTGSVVQPIIYLLAFGLGVAMGLVSGYYGGRIDALIMRLADVTLAFPTLLLLIAITAAFQPGLTVVFVAIGIVGWAGLARLVRSQTLVVHKRVKK